ncbi:hypothetical protein C8R44DRAFT_896095 [Mycena epipterygia]|nr:hypothetical protein C8R44DRAFT_896095 [Mycena epipterygia]
MTVHSLLTPHRRFWHPASPGVCAAPACLGIGGMSAYAKEHVSLPLALETVSIGHPLTLPPLLGPPVLAACCRALRPLFPFRLGFKSRPSAICSPRAAGFDAHILPAFCAAPVHSSTGGGSVGRMLTALERYFDPALARRLRRGYASERRRDISANSGPPPPIF